jgi:hypothetical protein
MDRTMCRFGLVFGLFPVLWTGPLNTSVDEVPKLNAYQCEACIYWKWQNYHVVRLAVLNAQWREGFEHTVIAKGKNTTQLSQETQNLPVAKGIL